MKGPDHVEVTLPVIGLGLAVGPLAIGSVHPNTEDGSVVGKEFYQLVDVVVVIGLALPVSGLGPIPGGQVDTELEAVTAGSLGNLADHIALASLPGRAGHAVLGVGTGPEAEAVVVLAGEDHPRHASGFKGLHPLVAVQVRRVEEGGILVAQAPFAVGHRVHAKVHESIHLHALPIELTAGWLDIGEIIQIHRNPSLEFVLSVGCLGLRSPGWSLHFFVRVCSYSIGQPRPN